MTAAFRRARKGGVVAHFDSDEEQVLRQVFAEMLALLGSAEDQSDDPLAAAVGIGTATTAPEDPALARLFPDGYRDDPEAAADFRRYTEPDLRAAKRESMQTVLATMAVDKVRLDDEQAEDWLRALNDTRLVLGERLGVTEELDELLDSLLTHQPDDPRLPLFWVYDRLTHLQETLVQALSDGF